MDPDRVARFCVLKWGGTVSALRPGRQELSL
jgi:hypothetical protein